LEDQLSVGALDKEAPFLQGWAIVENTTEGDWNDITLTLVSGRPISYTNGPFTNRCTCNGRRSS